MQNNCVVTEMQRKRHKRGKLNSSASPCIQALTILFTIYFLFPIVWLLLATTKSTTELYSLTAFEAGTSLIENVKWLNSYENGIFWTWCLNSIIFSGITAILSVLISSMGGYALTKYQFRFAKPISAVSFSSMMIPQAATVIPLFLIVKELGLVNTYPGVILPMIASPFGIYFMTTYLKDALPIDLIDSGRIDGANDYRIFFQIALPIMKPGIVTLFLISFISTWNYFFLPLVLLNDANLYPVTVGMKIWVSNLRTLGGGQKMYPLIMVGAFISIFPMLVLFTVLRKYITSGITMGSIKT